MLATSPTASACRPVTFVSEGKLTEHDQRLLRLAFDALARQASNSRVSFRSAKLKHTTPGSVEIDALIFFMCAPVYCKLIFLQIFLRTIVRLRR